MRRTAAVVGLTALAAGVAAPLSAQTVDGTALGRVIASPSTTAECAAEHGAGSVWDGTRCAAAPSGPAPAQPSGLAGFGSYVLAAEPTADGRHPAGIRRFWRPGCDGCAALSPDGSRRLTLLDLPGTGQVFELRLAPGDISAEATAKCEARDPNTLAPPPTVPIASIGVVLRTRASADQPWTDHIGWTPTYPDVVGTYTWVWDDLSCGPRLAVAKDLSYPAPDREPFDLTGGPAYARLDWEAKYEPDAPAPDSPSTDAEQAAVGAAAQACLDAMYRNAGDSVVAQWAACVEDVGNIAPAIPERLLDDVYARMPGGLPGAPTGYTVHTGDGPGEIRLTWSHGGGAAKAGYQYRYRRTIDKGWQYYTPWIDVPGGGAVTETVVSGLNPGVRYAFHMQAVGYNAVSPLAGPFTGPPAGAAPDDDDDGNGDDG